MTHINFAAVPVQELYLNPTFPMKAKNAPVAFLVGKRNGPMDEIQSEDVICVSLDPDNLVLLYGIKDADQSYAEINFRNHTPELDHVSHIFNRFTRIISYYNSLNGIIEVLTDQNGAWYTIGLEHLEYFIKATYLPDLSVKTTLSEDKTQLKVLFPDEPEIVIRVDKFNQAYC